MMMSGEKAYKAGTTERTMKFQLKFNARRDS